MAAPTGEKVTVSSSWLRSDPSDIMGHARPETFDELLKSGRPAWRRIYQEWLDDPSNQSRALPGFGSDEVLAVFNRLIDPSKPRSEADKVYATAFEEHYKSTFYEDVGKIKDQIHEKVEALKKQGVSEKNAKQQAGGQMAKDAITQKVKETAGGVDAPAALVAWAQVQQFKQEQLQAINDAVKEFRNDHWGVGGQRAEALEVLSTAAAAQRTAESVLRQVVTQIQSRAGAPKSPIPKQLEDELFIALTDWASALNGVGAAFARSSELVVEWAEENAAAIMESDFDASFKVLGGMLFAARTAVGVTGIVLSFFPALAPVASGLGLADTVIEAGVKKLTVFFSAKSKENMVKYAGKQWEIPQEYLDTAAGKVYAAKEKAKEKVENLKTAATDAVINTADAMAQQIFLAFPKARERKEDVERVLTELRAKAAQAGDDALEAVAGEYANDVKNLLTSLAEYCAEQAIDKVTDAIKDQLWDLFQAALPSVADAISKAMPGINIVIFVVQTGDDALNYWTSIHKKLAAGEGLTDADVKMLETLVSTQLNGKGGPVLKALNFDTVQFLDGTPDGNVRVSVAGVIGTFHPQTARFSPEDRGIMKLHVIEATKKNFSGGSFVHNEETFQIDWETFELGDSDTGEFTAKAKARRIKGKGGLTWATGNDGRFYAVDLWVDASGGAKLTDESLLAGDGTVDERAKHDPNKKLTRSPQGALLKGLDEKLKHNAKEDKPVPITIDDLEFLVGRKVAVDGKELTLARFEGGIRQAEKAARVSIDVIAEDDAKSATELTLLYSVPQQLQVEKVGRTLTAAEAKAQRQKKVDDALGPLLADTDRQFDAKRGRGETITSEGLASEKKKKKGVGVTVSHLFTGLVKKG